MSVTTKLLNCSRGGLSDRGDTWYSLGEENGTELAGTKVLWGKGETFGFYLESFHLWKQSAPRFQGFLPAAIIHSDLLSCHPWELPESRADIQFQFLTLKCRNQSQSLSSSLRQTPGFFSNDLKKKKKKLSVKLQQMAMQYFLILKWKLETGNRTSCAYYHSVRLGHSRSQTLKQARNSLMFGTTVKPILIFQ